MQDLVDSYMKPFQACVEKGQVSSLMCSYNAVNGVPSCANDWLLNTVARQNWDFDGYITSDCDADSDVFNSHHYTDTAEETVRDVLRAGMITCSSSMYSVSIHTHTTTTTKRYRRGLRGFRSTERAICIGQETHHRGRY